MRGEIERAFLIEREMYLQMILSNLAHFAKKFKLKIR